MPHSVKLSAIVPLRNMARRKNEFFPRHANLMSATLRICNVLPSTETLGNKKNERTVSRLRGRARIFRHSPRAGGGCRKRADTNCQMHPARGRPDSGLQLRDACCGAAENRPRIDRYGAGYCWNGSECKLSLRQFHSQNFENGDSGMRCDLRRVRSARCPLIVFPAPNSRQRDPQFRRKGFLGDPPVRAISS